MNRNELETFVRFNFWANDRLIEACERLTADAFTRSVTPNPGWGSLRGVLVHILDAEAGWRAVLESAREDFILEETDFPDVATLKIHWEKEQAAWLDFIRRSSDATLAEGYGQDPLNGPKAWQTIMHVITHGIQHRAEAAWILTGYGRSPGELDFDEFLQESPD